jgi:hypothetical protein
MIRLGKADDQIGAAWTAVIRKTGRAATQDEQRKGRGIHAAPL